jgi:hypothetical protein
MRVLKVALFSTALLFAAQSSCAQPSASPSYKSPDYKPSFLATADDVVGHYARTGDSPVDVWFAADGTARIVFVDSPKHEGRLGSTHEYAATWQIRHGWVDLQFDYGEVVLEFEPRASTLTARHALRSSLLLNFRTLSKVQGS